MSETDLHVHVEQKVAQTGADFRNAITSVFGLVPDAPSVVTTGCGLKVPYAMTSTRPESVTCLLCREYAHREYLSMADQIERLTGMPGMTFTAADATEAVARLRAVAKRFGS